MYSPNLEQAIALIKAADEGVGLLLTQTDVDARKIADLQVEIIDLNDTIGIKNVALASKDRMIDDLRAQIAALTPVTPMVLGVSATPGAFATGYPQQVKDLNAKAAFYYGKPGERVFWGPSLAAVPEDHILWLQVEDVGLLDLSGFPKTRKAPIRLHYFQEPENDIEKGTMTLGSWQANTDLLYKKIDAAGLPYIEKSVHLMSWGVTKYYNKTLTPAWDILNYLRPGVEIVGLSVYADKRVKDGHEVANTVPSVLPAKIGKYMKEVAKLPWDASAAGFALGAAYLNDPVSVQNRVTWTTDMAVECARNGAGSFQWFDITWPPTNSDYTIKNDAKLKAAWDTLPAKIKAVTLV